MRGQIVAVDTRTAAMKLLTVAAVIAVLILTGVLKFEFRWWTSSGASNVPAAKDVYRLADAAKDARFVAGSQNLAHYLNGINIYTPEGAAVLEHQTPAVAARMAEQVDEIRGRVAAVNVDTTTGRRLRAVFVRGLLATAIMYRDFAAKAANHRTSAAAAKQWVRRGNELGRWYTARIAEVLDETPSEDRPAVVAALNAI
jgi:hypothetical protein